MLQLSSYPNVYNTCLVWLQREGFDISYDKAREIWLARKGEVALHADNPIELLGLACIYEKTKSQAEGEYWWQIKEPNLISKFDPE